MSTNPWTHRLQCKHIRIKKRYFFKIANEIITLCSLLFLYALLWNEIQKLGSQLLITIQEWQQAQQILNQAILDIEMNKPATINQNGKKGLRQLVR
jgi:hypothetical protein